MNPEQKQLIFTLTHSSLLSINKQAHTADIAMSILIAERRIFIDQRNVIFPEVTRSAVTIFPGNIGVVVGAQHLNILGLISAVFTAINGIASGLSSLSGTAGLIAGFATAFASCSVVLTRSGHRPCAMALWRFNGIGRVGGSCQFFTSGFVAEARCERRAGFDPYSYRKRCKDYYFHFHSYHDHTN